MKTVNRVEILVFEQHRHPITPEDISRLRTHFNVFTCSRLEHATDELLRRTVDLILVCAERFDDAVVETCGILDKSLYGVRKIILVLPEVALEEKLPSVDSVLGIFPLEKTGTFAFINQLEVCAQIANQQHALKLGQTADSFTHGDKNARAPTADGTEKFQSDLVAFAELVQRTQQGTTILICIKEQNSLINLFGDEMPEVLTSNLSQRISRSLRQSDCLLSMPNRKGALLRIAPLELLLPVQQSSAEEMAIIEKRITDLLEEPIDIKGLKVPIDFKLGKANWQNSERSANDIVRSARNNAVFWTKATAQAKQSHDLESDLFDALANNEFELMYQPVYSLTEQPRIVGAEALLRWHRRHKEWVPPDVFIPVAEKTGLIKVIGRWVIEEVARQQNSWATQLDVQLSIAINISPAQLSDKDFLDHLLETFRSANIPNGAVELEITESCFISDPETTISLLNEIKATGFSIALDDFGTGYSSLSYLRNLPLDVLKVDRTFISPLDGNQYDPALTAGIIGLGLAMGLRIIAEGIETPQQWQLLKEWGCHEGQGFLMSRPVPADEITAMLDAPCYFLDKAS